MGPKETYLWYQHPDGAFEDVGRVTLGTGVWERAWRASYPVFYRAYAPFPMPMAVYDPDPQIVDLAIPLINVKAVRGRRLARNSVYFLVDSSELAVIKANPPGVWTIPGYSY